jgi:hypothetical protein
LNKSLFASLVVVVAACGGSDAPKGTVNTASARTSVDQVGTVNTSMMASNGDGAAAAVQAMTSAGQSIVTPAGASGRLLGMLPPSFPKTDIHNATGTADCTPTGCTFTSYGDASYMINGTINKSGDTVTFDLTYDITGGQALSWSIDGSVTVTATSIDGEVHSHGETSGSESGGFTVTWDTQVQYNAITLDGAGCPTAGSVHATLGYDVSGAQGGGSFDTQGTATFGPACGQVTAS